MYQILALGEVYEGFCIPGSARVKIFTISPRVEIAFWDTIERNGETVGGVWVSHHPNLSSELLEVLNEEALRIVRFRKVHFAMLNEQARNPRKFDRFRYPDEDANIIAYYNDQRDQKIKALKSRDEDDS